MKRLKHHRTHLLFHISMETHHSQLRQLPPRDHEPQPVLSQLERSADCHRKTRILHRIGKFVLERPCRTSHSVSGMSASFPSLISTTSPVPILMCLPSSSFLLQILHAGCVSCLAVWNSVFFIFTAKAESVSAANDPLPKHPQAFGSSPVVTPRCSFRLFLADGLRLPLQLLRCAIISGFTTRVSKRSAQAMDFDAVSHSASVFLVSNLRPLVCSMCSASWAASCSLPVHRELGCVLQSPSSHYCLLAVRFRFGSLGANLLNCALPCPVCVNELRAVPAVARLQPTPCTRSPVFRRGLLFPVSQSSTLLPRTDGAWRLTVICKARLSKRLLASTLCSLRQSAVSSPLGSSLQHHASL